MTSLPPQTGPTELQAPEQMIAVHEQEASSEHLRSGLDMTTDLDLNLVFTPQNEEHRKYPRSESLTGLTNSEEAVPSPHAVYQLRESILDSTRPHLAALHKQRTDLVTKELQGALTPADKKRLAYIRWKIERFEIAELQSDIKQLEAARSSHETVARSVADLTAQLQRMNIAPPRSRR